MIKPLIKFPMPLFLAHPSPTRKRGNPKILPGWNPHQQRIADRCISDFHYLIRHELLESYSEARPYARPARRTTHHFTGDCTSTIKLVVCDWNGIPHFDGEPSGYGNTGTFYRGPRIYRMPLDPAKWQPLDIILYKRTAGTFRGGPGEHATILLDHADGHWHVCSHGGDSGPKYLPWDYRHDAVVAIRFPIPRK